MFRLASAFFYFNSGKIKGWINNEPKMPASLQGSIGGGVYMVIIMKLTRFIYVKLYNTGRWSLKKEISSEKKQDLKKEI